MVNAHRNGVFSSEPLRRVLQSYNAHVILCNLNLRRLAQLLKALSSKSPQLYENEKLGEASGAIHSKIELLKWMITENT